MLERETGLKPTSLGKYHYISYQGFSEQRRSQKPLKFAPFPQFGREWNHKGITDRKSVV